MKYKALIFDMDGTITKTEQLWQKASMHLIAQKNRATTPEQETELKEQLHGRALQDSCFLIKQVMNLDDHLEDLIQEKLKIALELYETDLEFIEGFESFHAKVLSLQLKMAVATNAGQSGVHATNKALNLQKFFGEHIYNVSHVNNPKPHPELYLHAADQIAVDPKLCIAIEDSAPGITAAKEAGMFCIGINTGKKPEKLQHAHLVVDRYDEIDLHELLNIDNKL